jgi:hypothetical protein
MKTATRYTVRKNPEEEKIKDATAEIRGIQENFAILREAGICTSPYPQLSFSRILGCTVREVRAKDMIR